MARITFQQVIAEVQRMPGLGRISLGEIIDKIATAAKDLGNQPWPWNYAETNVLVPPAYTTGLIDVTNGTNVITGTIGSLPTWDVSWYGRRIRFSNSNLDYIIQSIVNPTTILLAQPVNLGASIAGGSYTLYQDTYTYPTDYILGSDVALLQPVVRARIPKIPRYKFEMIMNSGMRSFSTNIQMFYCDHGEDLTSGTATSRLYRFRLGPPPGGPAELRLCYHQMAPDLVPTQMTTFPEGYDELISLTAAAKLYDLHKMPGESEAAKALALGKIRLLKRQVATQTIDDVPDAAYEVADSSISQWGMMIGRM
jgi:hypothetical protein